MPDPRLSALTTPCLLVDETRMVRNIDNLSQHAANLGVTLRPHLKTTKCVEAARYVLADGTGPATVSTLAEAEVFAQAGITDILYGVGISTPKLNRVIALHRAGCRVTVLLDNAVQAQAVADASRAAGIAIPALIEIDSDGHRSGLTSSDPALIEVGRILHEGGADLRGVLCHAGESYGAVGRAAHAKCAEQERLAVVDAATALRDAGLPCPIVSVGSTPTAHGAKDLSGVTELRAGVYVFFDLVMAGIEVCSVDDIALSVLTTVIGHQTTRGWTICDAGWMAMSRDRGTAAQRVDQGYGVVCDEAGTVIPGLIVLQANQEHGVIARHPDFEGDTPDFPVGTRLRILPNHACATAAQHQHYHVVPEQSGAPLMMWSRFGGW
ncbi:D-serine deaminase-like pyridoxal phosphate-dependent protein [Litoreibacter halocynthiae]|uniref:D-serine deaminase-like pyridoxal phosphate-dependent protein n=1 Tax=Litoreibacter halocynthiae TaxID=1242689 RepID=A0A4R7LI36_9RHOB|nr:alanine racemase [Litoreibacter halocynthiae]TDT74252.1 D-serine deaminase-like pyridoxal phosphate-dependent protein [Litoreibacter halocynthiae]